MSSGFEMLHNGSRKTTTTTRKKVKVANSAVANTNN